MGADPGYIGFGQTPTIYSRVMMRPFSVVVLDEFEKSDPSLSNPLLSILDGWGVDNQGRPVDFSQCIFIMTSNAIMLDPPSLDGAEDERVDEALRQVLLRQAGIWTAPLLDRIDRVCLFRSLEEDKLLEILGGLVETRRRLATRPLPPQLDDPEVRRAILADAVSGGNSSSARRLERALMRWLALRSAAAGEAAAAVSCAE
jgi:ATP-dependent Clp protease ATP-binding subunit ClpA